jgi:DNA-binding transcriptional LysR family regulator
VTLSVEDPDRLAIEQVFGNLGIQRRIQVEAQHSESACAFVANGAGVTIIDPLTPMEFGSDRIVARPFAPPVYLNIWLLWPSHKVRPNLGVSFAATVRDWLLSSFPTCPTDIQA